MKKFPMLASTLVVSAIAFNQAHAELSANIGVTSDYVWRGVSQSANESAVQGGIDYAADNGFFAGVWVSDTAFNSSETDLYIGYGGEAGDFSYSLMFNYYLYPSIEADSDFGEIMADFGFGPVSFGVAYTAVSELDEIEVNNGVLEGSAFFVEGDLYYYIGVGGDVGEGWSLSGTYGFYDFDSDGFGGVDTSYGYFEFSAAKDLGDFGEFAFTVSVADDEAQLVAGDADADELKTRVSWSKSF